MIWATSILSGIMYSSTTRATTTGPKAQVINIVYNYCFNLHKHNKFPKIYILKFIKTCNCLVRRTELVYKKSLHHMHFQINVHMEFIKNISNERNN